MPEIGRREKCEHFESDNKVTHQRILKRNVKKAVSSVGMESKNGDG
jgi:hypothetical protein